MRKWLFLIFLAPASAEAGDLHIHVDYVVRQERVRPQPQIVRPKISQHFLLREDGTVEVQSEASGKNPDKFKASTRLGKDQFKVLDARTISRSWSLGAQKRTLTITTDGKGCTAKLEIYGATEFESRSTDLNQMALYRNPQVESITCRIDG